MGPAAAATATVPRVCSAAGVAIAAVLWGGAVSSIGARPTAAVAVATSIGAGAAQ